MTLEWITVEGIKLLSPRQYMALTPIEQKRCRVPVTEPRCGYCRTLKVETKINCPNCGAAY